MIDLLTFAFRDAWTFAGCAALLALCAWTLTRVAYHRPLAGILYRPTYHAGTLAVELDRSHRPQSTFLTQETKASPAAAAGIDGPVSAGNNEQTPPIILNSNGEEEPCAPFP